MKFGEKLKLLREREEITQMQLAQELETPVQTVTDWETGLLMPDVPAIVEISRRFGVTTDYLLKDEIAYGKTEKTTDEEASEKAGKRLLSLIMGVLSLIILAFTPMFARSIQLKELSLGEAFQKWSDYILRAPLIYIFLLAAVGIVVSIYLYFKNRK